MKLPEIQDKASKDAAIATLLSYMRPYYDPELEMVYINKLGGNGYCHEMAYDVLNALGATGVDGEPTELRVRASQGGKEVAKTIRALGVELLDAPNYEQRKIRLIGEHSRLEEKGFPPAETAIFQKKVAALPDEQREYFQRHITITSVTKDAAARETERY